MINGSPRQNGNIALAFSEMEKIFDENDIEYENIQIGKMDIRGCIACESCRQTGKCVFNDIVNELSAKLEDLNKVVRYCTSRTVLLQCASAHSKYLG